jgi:hypothetical protein
MQTQTKNSTTDADILQQFSEMLKSHSIVVSDRENLVKLLENIVELCTQMPKTKLKAAVKAASNPAPAKKAPAKKQEDALVGPADAADCPMITDIKPAGRGRGRPRKDASVVPFEPVNDSPAADAEKKKRGRPKKDKTMIVSSNDDEDALIAKMIADVKSMKSDEESCQTVAAAAIVVDDDQTESEAEEDVEGSLSPVCVIAARDAPAQVEADLPVAKESNEVTANAVKEVKTKAVKEVKTKAVKAKAVKEPKEVKAKAVKEPKEVKVKAVKEPKEVKVKAVKEVKEVKANEVISTIDIVASATSAAPLRENRANSDGKFYLMTNYPRSSFSYSGKTYLRTENDNVYDTMTFELIGVWDHLNHEIITTFDDDEDELLFSDEE